MVVRFLPVPDLETRSGVDPAPEREGLAEVVELRSRLLGAVAKVDHAVVADIRERPGDESVDDAREYDHASVNRGDGRLGGHAQGTTVRRFRNDEPRESSRHGQTEQAGPKRTATEDGVRVLARRARSAGEVRRALIDLGHDKDDVEDVLAEFARSGYLDDADLARALTTSLRERSKASRSQIRRKLIDRHIGLTEIETALGELDADDELTILYEAARQRAGKMGNLDRTTAERRLLGFLARRGWSGQSARSAAVAALDSVGICR